VDGATSASATEARRLAALQRDLDAAATVAELFQRASTLARVFCAADRAIVLTLDPGRLDAGRLTADRRVPLADAGSEGLRRSALATDLPLEPDTEEARLIRLAERRRDPGEAHRSVLVTRLRLRGHAFAPVLVADRVQALLVVDRGHTLRPPADWPGLAVFAHILGITAERTALRARLSQISAGIQHTLTSPLGCPDARLPESGPTPPGLMTTRAALNDDCRALTQRETDIIELIALGCTNHEISERLHLSPDTIKVNVTRILRKLDAVNRVAAAAAYVALRGDAIHTSTL
jgi:DNA-binding CsgD family transcriptional regulator